MVVARRRGRGRAEEGGYHLAPKLPVNDAVLSRSNQRFRKRARVHETSLRRVADVNDLCGGEVFLASNPRSIAERTFTLMLPRYPYTSTVPGAGTGPLCFRR